MSHPESLRGKLVRFRINDAHVPEPAEILAELHRHALLEGCVSDLTDSGEGSPVFAVVDVKQLGRPVVVPARCLMARGTDETTRTT